MDIKRERYLSWIRPSYDVDIIKVITGVRRSGKSVLLSQIKEEILAKGIAPDHIIEVNFEDVAFEGIRTYKKLDKYIQKRIKDENKYYVFLDEIQHVRSFERCLASLKATRGKKISIFISGSNSKLLSGRLATKLVGRCIEYRVLPFSYSEAKEYLALNKKETGADFFNDYLTYGGLPQRFDYQGRSNVMQYVSSVYNGIVDKDICTPKSKINKEHFSWITSYVMANAGKQFSAENVAKFFEKENDWATDKVVVYRYLDKMEKACLISRVKRYNVASKRTMKQMEKQYVVDNGFRTVNLLSESLPREQALENLVYNELIYRGYQVLIGKTYKGEIDFVVTGEEGKCFVQVCYLLSSQDVVDREFGAFSSVKDASPKYVLSLDPLENSQNGIKNINIIDWLEGRKKLQFS